MSRDEQTEQPRASTLGIVLANATHMRHFIQSETSHHKLYQNFRRDDFEVIWGEGRRGGGGYRDITQHRVREAITPTITFGWLTTQASPQYFGLSNRKHQARNTQGHPVPYSVLLTIIAGRCSVRICSSLGCFRYGRTYDKADQCTKQTVPIGGEKTPPEYSIPSCEKDRLKLGSLV